MDMHKGFVAARFRSVGAVNNLSRIPCQAKDGVNELLNSEGSPVQFRVHRNDEERHIIMDDFDNGAAWGPTFAINRILFPRLLIPGCVPLLAELKRYPNTA